MKDRTLSEDLIVTAIGVAKGTNAEVPHAEVTSSEWYSTSSTFTPMYSYTKGVGNTDPFPLPSYKEQLENRVEYLTNANVELAKDRAFYRIAFQVLLFIDVLYIVWSFIL